VALDFPQIVFASALDAAFTALFVGVAATFVVRWYENRADARRRQADHEHEEEIQERQLEFQTRAALRDCYAQLLVAQRSSREASVELARAGRSGKREQEKAAVQAHGEFIDRYHRLNLDADRAMWEDARALRRVLDELLKAGQQGDMAECELLVESARKARQNLERSFRLRLGHDPLQDRQ
jgi:hypothetical protein